MLTAHNPAAAAAAFSRYSLGVEVPPQARWLFVSGQVGVDPEGRLAEGAKAQMRRCWQNIFAILAEAGMGAGDLVRINAYLTRAEDVALYRDVRDEMLDGAAPASTLVVVQALAQPGWLVEIEAVAAAA